LGSLGTAAINRPIVPALGDYDDGEIDGIMIGRGNRSTRRKPAPVPLCPPQTPHAARTRTRATAFTACYKDSFTLLFTFIGIDLFPQSSVFS
jgi:hypothetical protein